MEVVKVCCLKHIYPDKTEVSLCGLDFVVQKGQRVVVLGANGSGKTTLLSHVLGLLCPVEGQVEVVGKQPYKQFNEVRKHLGVVFQNVDEQIIGPTVYDDIAFTAKNDKMPKDEISERVNAIAKTLKIESLLEKIPHYLSGGQKKKVALAGAMVTDPDILILDEPFDSLDPRSKWEMVDYLNQLNQEKNTSLIITTHDINVVPKIADVVYVIDKGVFKTKGNPEEVFSQIEILKEANLEAPLLTDLFARLRNKGYDLNVPISVEDAEREILKVLQGQ
ncbi:cobalt/nickel transport system ATP-binding protein [Natranaerovirga hydrolytica]|uniref:Cobalt/nickel transport system ATP-binding protein n=1 Tax=Natranaerovirga hydrolytica TaxID=680378 RepID=A0A4R1N594_9FIRM|nr:ATP-binding cassette domain-containing protein [Natranaerovirga hydrolytica]TCK97773.1 cobalt/nickel transport system ATP-binding protein [Natranaerovirga hydrolytica]